MLACQYEVGVDLERCSRTILDVRPVQVVNKPAYTALHQVSNTGLNQALHRNCTRAGSVFMWYMLLVKL